MAQHWNLDPKTKDWVLKNGAPEQTDSLTIPAYIRLKAHRKKWMYAPNTDWGSDFYLVQKRQSTQDASAIENIAARALQPIADDGRAQEISISTVLANRNNVGLQIDILDADNEEQTIVLPQV